MKAATDLMRDVNVVAFCVLAITCGIHEHRRRTFRTWWASVAFGSLAVLGVLSLVLENSMTDLGDELTKVILIVLVLFPYFLYRFVASFERLARPVAWVANVSTAAVVAFTLLLPTLPLPGLPQPYWLLWYRIAVLVQWTILFAIVSARLWVAGKGEATAPRRRMRTLAAGTVGLNCAVLVGGIIEAPVPLNVLLATQLLSLVSAVLFYVGLAPPRWLLHLWRRREEDTFRRTMAGLFRAEDQAEVVEVLLPRVVELAGARGAALVNTEGAVLGATGRTGSAAEIVEQARVPTITERREVQRMHVRSGTLVIWTSPYSPYFGTAELSLIEGLGLFIDLALERCALAEGQRVLEASLTYRAQHDDLTGLPNRSLFTDRLHQALGRLGRREGAVTVQFLDLDRFKDVNDIVDHAAGDALLVSVAHRLTAAVRTQDTVARFGGDEFVFLAEVGDEAEAMTLANRLLSSLATPFMVAGRELTVSASVGVVVTTEPCETSVLLRDADTAMYRAKDEGRGRIAVFDEGLRTRAVERLELERGLRRAIQASELRLHYQPLLDLDTGRISGVEALVRWEHPRFGLLAPAEFIPIAEESDLIDAVGAWVLREACQQAARWREALDGRPLVTWVNVSPAQLVRTDIAAVTSAALHDAGLDPDRLGLELTESTFVDLAEERQDTMAALGALGVGLAIDDFGTGFSSLGVLKRYPADVLKIDGSFVHGLGDDVEDTAIVSACVALADALDLTVVAESVETTEQHARLLELGCRVGQGYLFCNPLPAAELTRYLLRQVGQAAPVG